MAVATEPIDVPEYRELYYEWEKNQWEAGAIDLSVDRAHWQHVAPEVRESFLWWLSSFYVGEAGVTDHLVPFVDAAPTEEQGVFLTTQLVDQARHTVFFDRFYDEALEVAGADMEDRVERQARRLDPTQRRLLDDELPAVADRIRDGYGLAALVEGVTLYHLVIEGTIGITGHRYLLDHVTERDVFPGFRAGLEAVQRDSIRHVSFGTRFLREAVDTDSTHVGTIRTVLDRCLPLALALFDPTGPGAAHFVPLSFDPEILTDFAHGSLHARLKTIGVDLPA